MVYSIVNEQPEPVIKYRPELSSEVLHILDRSLEKNPEERYQNVQEMVIDLKRAKKTITPVYHPVPIPSASEQQPLPSATGRVDSIAQNRKMGNTRLVFSAALLVLALTIIIFLVKPMLKKPLPPFKIVPLAASPDMEQMPAFSPVGNQIAYTWLSNDLSTGAIYIKLIGTGNPLRLTSRPGSYYNPVWSSDGRTIIYLRYFGAETGIYQIPALGGAEQRLMAIDSTNFRDGLDWSPDGRHIIYSDRDSSNVPNGIFMLTLSNMKKHQLTFPPVGTIGDMQPVFSPDGKWVAFIRIFSFDTDDIFIIPSAGGAAKRITSDNLAIPNLA